MKTLNAIVPAFPALSALPGIAWVLGLLLVNNIYLYFAVTSA
jgi:hypothetical protein